jgi:uncharacterized membrane protein
VIKCERENFLSKLEHDRILQAIREAESKTSGEIRVFIQRGKLKMILSRRTESSSARYAQDRERNAVLIFCRRVFINSRLLGQAIHKKCGDEFWQPSWRKMRTHFQNEVSVMR